MDDLRKHLDEATTALQSADPDINMAKNCLEAAARDWARASLETFQGTLLRRALDISGGIIDFCHELDVGGT